MHESPYHPEQAQDAYTAVAAQLDELAPDALRRLNTNAYQAGVRGLAVAQALQDPSVGRLFDALPTEVWEARAKAGLGQLAWALLHAVTQAQVVGEPADAGKAAMAAANEGMRLRRGMLELVAYNLRDAESAAMVKRLRTGAGFFNLAEDLQILARIYREQASVLGRDRFFQLGHADEAEAIVARLFAYLGAQTSEENWQLQVRRCWTLFAKAYEEVHRVARFLFERDPVRLARFPNLYVR